MSGARTQGRNPEGALNDRSVSWIKKYHGDKYSASALRPSPAALRCWEKRPGENSRRRLVIVSAVSGQPKSVNRPYWEKSYSGGPIDVKPLPPVLPGKGYKPVVVPNGGALPFKVVDGVKVFHLIAEEVDHFFDAGLRAKCWGFNGRVNSTVIEAVEGERVRIYVTNRLSRGDCDPLAWLLSTQRHGWRRRADPAVHQARRDREV